MTMGDFIRRGAFRRLAMVATLCAAAMVALPALFAGNAQSAEKFYERHWTVTESEDAARVPAPTDEKEIRALQEAMVQTVMQEANAARRRYGRGALRFDGGLNIVAHDYSATMKRRDFFGHVSPEGVGFASRLPAEEGWRFKRSGENLWKGVGKLNWRADALAVETVKDWIASPSHRENLLDAEYDLAGVGVVIGDEQVLVTMIYGREFPDLELAREQAKGARPPADIAAFAGELEYETLRSLNVARGGVQLPLIARDQGLSEIARSYSAKMIATGAISAGGPELGDLIGLVRAGAARGGGQISVSLWRGDGMGWSPERVGRSVVQTLTQDPQNLGNLTGPDFDIAGVGAAVQGDRTYVTIIYVARQNAFPVDDGAYMVRLGAHDAASAALGATQSLMRAPRDGDLLISAQ